MSQTAQAQQIESTVPPAFRRVPINPHTDKVKEALENQPAPVAPVAPVAPPPHEVAPVLPPQYAQPQPAPQFVPPAPQYDPRALAAMQQMQAEYQRLSDEHAAQQETIQNLLTHQQELAALKQRQALQESLSKDAFNELETVDPNDAKRIVDAVLGATTPAFNSIQQELEKTRKMMADNAQQMQQRMTQAQVNQVNQRILAAHPDFFQLQHTPEYHAFMNQRDGLSSQTRDQRAAQEFNAGNADYVVELLNQLKGAVPSAASITTVAPVQTASAVTPAAAAPQSQTMTLGELNNLIQMRQISHDEYRARLKEWRAAQKA